MYDIDDFKKFNDTYGHLFGDLVLKSIAGLVKKSIRKNDIVARFGGEEFVIMFPYTNAESAYEKAEALRWKISNLVVTDKEYSASVTVSMGVSSFPEHWIQLLIKYDAALYCRKKEKLCNYRYIILSLIV